jgi:serine/threonine protein kinase
MSPEQARGQSLDRRADIWAFGCVLYEMLTGRAAFGGDTISDTLAAILEREPDLTVLPAARLAPIRDCCGGVGEGSQDGSIRRPMLDWRSMTRWRSGRQTPPAPARRPAALPRGERGAGRRR